MTDGDLLGFDSDVALRALVVLRAADRAEREPAPRISTEQLLYEAGLSHAQIGVIVGDKADTVRKRLARAGAGQAEKRKAANK